MCPDRRVESGNPGDRSGGGKQVPGIHGRRQNVTGTRERSLRHRRADAVAPLLPALPLPRILPLLPRAGHQLPRAERGGLGERQRLHERRSREARRGAICATEWNLSVSSVYTDEYGTFF